MFQVNLEQIRQQLRANMDVMDENDFETSFMIGQTEILVSFFRNESFNEYNQYGLDHWILRFQNMTTNKYNEIWVPYPRTQITRRDVINIIMEYIERGYVQDLI